MTIIFVAELEAFQLSQMFEVFVEERENPQKAQTVMEGELLNHAYNATCHVHLHHNMV